MSRFFDILKKSHEQLGDLSSDSIAEAAERVENVCDTLPIPVEEAKIRPESRIVFHTHPRGPGADRFRFLRMRLRELWNAGKVSTLLITSPLPGDGKSTVALNLATALAEQGKRAVLLVEADFHHPSLTQQLGIQNRPGLAECLEHGVNPMLNVRRIEPLGWYLLSSGEPHSNPTELLQSETLSTIVQELSANFDWILIDSPPVMPLTDALSLARHADASLLVARAGHTPRQAIEQTVKQLGNEHVIGVLLNGVEGLHRIYSKYYGYYGGNSSSPTAGSVDNSEESNHRQVIAPENSNRKLRRVIIRVPRTAFWGITARTWTALALYMSKAPMTAIPDILRLRKTQQEFFQ